MRGNKILDISILIIGVLSILYFFFLKAMHISFSEIFLLIGAILIVYSTIELIYNISLWHKAPKIFKNIVILICIVCTFILIGVEALIINGGNHKDLERPDYIVVLGAGIRGTEISLSLKNRLDNAIEFNKIHKDVKIIVSGGQGPGEDITEALAMKRYLTENGVDEDLIIMEEKSTSTYENLLFTKKILNPSNNMKIKITIITNEFHTFRAKLIGEKLGFDVLTYPAQNFKKAILSFYLREFLSVIKAFLQGYLV